MNNIAKSIANILYEQGDISSHDVETCSYGIEVFLISAVEIVSILLISVFVGNFFETFLMFLAFVPLRVYAGGYHADTRLRCYLVSIGVYILFTVVMVCFSKYINSLIGCIGSIMALLAIIKYAPVVHHNKNVTDTEIKNFRKMSILICTIETAVICILTISNINSKVYASMLLGQISVALSMMAAMVKNKIVENK